MIIHAQRYLTSVLKFLENYFLILFRNKIIIRTKINQVQNVDISSSVCLQIPFLGDNREYLESKQFFGA